MTDDPRIAAMSALLDRAQAHYERGWSFDYPIVDLDEARAILRGENLPLELDEQEDTRIRAVLAMHVQEPNIDLTAMSGRCDECGGTWPCATVRALGVTS